MVVNFIVKVMLISISLLFSKIASQAPAFELQAATMFLCNSSPYYATLPCICIKYNIFSVKLPM